MTAMSHSFTNILLSIVSVLTTNWHDSYQTSTLMYPPEANTIFYHENGTVYSNRVARLRIEGKDFELTLSSEAVGTLWRNYTFSKPEKQYGPVTGFEPILRNVTNWWPTNAWVGTNYFTNTNGPIFLDQFMRIPPITNRLER